MNPLPQPGFPIADTGQKKFNSSPVIPALCQIAIHRWLRLAMEFDLFFWGGGANKGFQVSNGIRVTTSPSDRCP